MTHYNKKMWTLGGCLADHRKVFSSLPSIMGAYVGKHAVDPELNESVMVTVNSVNSCPYCEGLHGQLARMAGVENQEELMKAANVEECRALVDDPAITYARVFAENDGRGNLEEEGFQSLSQKTSAGFANSVRALCWFLLWGSIGGNTINGFLARLRGQGKPGSSALFELPVFPVLRPTVCCDCRGEHASKSVPKGSEVVLCGIWCSSHHHCGYVDPAARDSLSGGPCITQDSSTGLRGSDETTGH